MALELTMTGYEVITAIVATYGALLATYTLIEQIRAKKRTVKASFHPGFIAYGNQLGEQMFILEAGNTGHVDVTIAGHSILLPNKTQIVFPNAESEHQFPYTLSPGRGTKVWFPAKKIAEALKEKGYSGKVSIRGKFSDQTTNKFKSNRVKFEIESWL